MPYAAVALDGEVEYRDPSLVFALARASLGLGVTPEPSLGLEVLGGYPIVAGIPRRCAGAGAASPYLEGPQPSPAGFGTQSPAADDLQLLIPVVGVRGVIGPRSRRWGRGSTVFPMAQAGLRYLRTWDADAVEGSLANTKARVHSASNPLRQRALGSAHVTALLAVVPTERRVGGGVSVEFGRVVTLASLRLLLVVGVGHNAATGFTARMGVQLAPLFLAAAPQPRAAVPTPAGCACLCWQAP